MNTQIVDTINPLVPLLQKLEYHTTIKNDILVPSGHIRYNGFTGLLEIAESEYKISEFTHSQIAGKLEIPFAYYKKMKTDFPALLESNINGWLSRKENVKYLLRTFNYKEEGVQNLCRAMLSDRYAILDNYDVLLACLEAVKKMGVNVEIQKADVTENKMYLRIVCPEVQIQAEELLKGYLQNQDQYGVGNGIMSGIIISNSETGSGGFEVSPSSCILKCLNGLVDRSNRYRRIHLGAKMDEGTISWSKNTKNKNFELVISQISDAIKTFLSKEYLGQTVKKLEAAKGILLEHPTAVIEHVSTALGISDTHKADILRHFIHDNEYSALGVFHAVTRTSQSMDPDARFETESSIWEMLPSLKRFDHPISKN